MLGFPVALLTVNAFEWYAHRVWLHEYPRKNRNSPFFSHIRHHKNVRLNAFADDAYNDSMLKNNEIFFEQTTLIGLCAVFTPTAAVAPFFTLGIYYGAWQYWRKHSRAHLDPQWAKANVPWHYDHHMNTNQDANWCVTRPWFDYIMGTRVIGDETTAESNPLGMDLPQWLEKPVNKIARRFLPKAFARLDENRATEHARKQSGEIVDIAAA
ncbi:MAG: sterol desaturase family protein [Gammaproteobacteria bacterium]|jgi:sterol desaturase/sphingolipid hydroxylase (fatty acid hydroxylase superfamily)|nr:sterol desaturase family protein [Gammaproteobacteria bacterium]MBQ0773666.1 sterol desaturase family protein [Gammaproteobacteria bacterium]|tara:strand:+ start:48583 stop:49215 length:633 start_codon:yes stop_codon:yes gene_type:complete